MVIELRLLFRARYLYRSKYVAVKSLTQVSPGATQLINQEFAVELPEFLSHAARMTPQHGTGDGLSPE